MLINHATVVSSTPQTLTDTNYHEVSLAGSEAAWAGLSALQVKPTVMSSVAD